LSEKEHYISSKSNRMSLWFANYVLSYLSLCATSVYKSSKKEKKKTKPVYKMK